MKKLRLLWFRPNGKCGTASVAAWGDVIKFAMLYEHLEFPEALRFLAEKAGIPIQTMSPTQQREFGILYDLHEEAKNFYKAELAKNQSAQKYLKDRGIKPETIDEFDLGYSPGGDSLTVFLIKKGYAVGDVVRAGLSHKIPTAFTAINFSSG